MVVCITPRAIDNTPFTTHVTRTVAIGNLRRRTYCCQGTSKQQVQGSVRCMVITRRATSFSLCSPVIQSTNITRIYSDFIPILSKTLLIIETRSPVFGLVAGALPGQHDQSARERSIPQRLCVFVNYEKILLVV